MTMQETIPRLDARAIEAGAPETLALLRRAATATGFFTVSNTALEADRVIEVIACFRRFFRRPAAEKAVIDMARTGANRGWGAPGSEQVDPRANPDFKQFFDMGFSLPPAHPLSAKPVYAPNLWPENDPEFRTVLEAYYRDALSVAESMLHGVITAIGADPAHFEGAFETPMALLRGNYYPQRPDWAGDRDFGIATHTDYGCLTLLATDGTPGLEVRRRGGGWIPVTAPPGEFIINFGEMLELWTGGRVKATPHRVVGGPEERISVPLFFNPNWDTNVAPPGADRPILAGDYLSARFAETYVHLQRD